MRHEATMTQTTDYLSSRPQPGDLRFGRSKVSNSPDLLLGKDARSVTARRFRDLVQNLIADAGGIENCSVAKICLLRRLAAVSVLSEMAEAKAVDGEDVDATEICTLASTAVRLASRVGLSRYKKDVTPRLEDYRPDANQDQLTEEDAA
jgi:hypothetical protein